MDHQLSSQEEVEIPMPINSAYGGILHGYNDITNKQVEELQQQQEAHQGYNGNFTLPEPKKMDVIIRYRECQKNHAASIGGNALDGCGEFMASGQEGLTCSVCNCHRNFHRKEIEGDQHKFQFYPPTPHNALMNSRGRNVILGSPTIGSHMNVIPINNIAHGNGNGSGNGNDNGGIMVIRHPINQVVKRRFRTKFSQEQKEKMFEFAEKIGWKFQKQEESVVQQFCQEIGVKRRVLKVWMHNNKHNLVNKSNDLANNNNSSSSL